MCPRHPHLRDRYYRNFRGISSSFRSTRCGRHLWIVNAYLRVALKLTCSPWSLIAVLLTFVVGLCREWSTTTPLTRETRKESMQLNNTCAGSSPNTLTTTIRPSRLPASNALAITSVTTVSDLDSRLSTLHAKRALSSIPNSSFLGSSYHPAPFVTHSLVLSNSSI
jgi:hypothetical protein